MKWWERTASRSVFCRNNINNDNLIRCLRLDLAKHHRAITRLCKTSPFRISTCFPVVETQSFHFKGRLPECNPGSPADRVSRAKAQEARWELHSLGVGQLQSPHVGAVPDWWGESSAVRHGECSDSHYFSWGHTWSAGMKNENAIMIAYFVFLQEFSSPVSEAL